MNIKLDVPTGKYREFTKRTHKLNELLKTLQKQMNNKINLS